MLKKICKLPIIAPVLFFLFVWCFWSLGYPYVLSYQEQMQMFLFDGNYFAERVIIPGGFARYCAEFFTQFGFIGLYGGLVVAILLTLLQVITWLASKGCTGNKTLYFLTFAPSLVVLVFMADENYRMTILMAVMFAMLAIVAYPFAKKPICRIVTVLLLTPALYWLAGPSVLIFSIYVFAREGYQNRNYIIGVVALAYSVALILLSIYFVPYPMSRILLGVTYYAVPDILPMLYALFFAVAIIIPILRDVMPEETKPSMKYTSWAVQAVVLVLMLVFTMPTTFNKSKLDILQYDYYVRSQNWDAIINKAQKKTPDTPLTVASLNLALAMKGQLNQRAFDFFQNGWEGAFPSFNKGAETSIVLADVFFYTGMVNMTQLFAFEANEAIPDNNKSIRMYKRLAETNLINGQYGVAKKYLNKLEKTLFYASWAKGVSKLLYDEKAIANHPVYGYVRKVRLTEDFLYSDKEIDKIMGQLMMHNPNNYVAAQYLLLLPQLEGNRQKYMMYKKFVEKALKK